MKNIALLFCFSFLFHFQNLAQGCCSGGSGSPMIGGVSMGVLQQGQFDLGESIQYYYSDKFLVGNKDSSSAMVKDLQTTYLYARLGYGITSKLSIYGEVGYFLNKTETGYDSERPDYKKESAGFGDLIILPRYNVYEKSNAKRHFELTLGLGIKIPLGNAHDSTPVYINPSNGNTIQIISPPTVQTTTGSNDFIFYGFALQEFKKAKLKVFISGTYMYKGYNALGEKFGDFLGIGLFASKTYFRKLGLTGQFRFEHIGKMLLSPNVDFIAQGISVEPASTGGSKISFVPQVTYSLKSVTLYAMYDLPLYQYMNGLQIANKNLLTFGVNIRFKPKKFVFNVSAK